MTNLLNTRALRITKALTVAGLVLGLAASLSACAPTMSHQGYLAIDADPSKDIKVGDGIDVVREKLGSPSQTATYEPNVWYYIDQLTSKMTYKQSKVIARKVTVITFDKGMQNVSEVKTLTLADSRSITPNPNETPTRGRSLSALEQILGTVGRQSITRDQDQNPGNNRRRD
jgi:outer membrane protein assembly factor BamE (lipoprotein component of BamABCDE complex)